MKPRLPREACSPIIVVGLIYLAALFLAWLASCAGPYRGPDAIPDRFRVGYSETEFDTLEEFIPGEAYSFSLEWDLQPPALPDETDAKRNRLLEQILAEQSADNATPDGNAGILAQIERHWVVSMFILIALAGAGTLPLILKRLGVDKAKQSQDG